MGTIEELAERWREYRKQRLASLERAVHEAQTLSERLEAVQALREARAALRRAQHRS